jgi:ABC-type uncharacterized transport system involved in gliding motility auxiliary subunit
MSDAVATIAYVRRCEALLAEYGAAEEERVDLLSSFTEPFSVEQKAQLMACAARRDTLLRTAHKFARAWFIARRI